MLAKKSILKLERFSIVKSSCETLAFEEFPDSIQDYMQNYSIDIDFDILETPNVPEEKKGVHFISVKIIINPEKKPGYHIVTEGLGLFSFPTDIQLNDDTKSNFLLSGVNICITNLRSFISTITTNYPFDQYLFPTIDMNDLIEKKKKQIQESEMNQKH